MQLFHILHDPTFDADYSHFQQNPNSASLSWLALLFSILSIAVTALDENNSLLFDLGRRLKSSENIAILSLRYRTAAIQCLNADHYLWRHTLYTLQALILLIYGINHSHGQSWALLGTAYNIALALGCHIDPSRFNLNTIQCEERRRCWAGLIMLHTVQNTAMGHLDLRSIANTVNMPANVNDMDLVAGIVARESESPTQMSYILYKFRLYDLCSRICGQLFGHSPCSSYQTIVALDDEIAREQELSNTRYLSDSQNGPIPTYHAVHLNILHGYAHQLFLLVHRPVFSKAMPVRPEELRKSRERCISSSRALLGIHRMLYESAEFAPFRWYNQGLGSFHAFHAAVVLFAVLADAESSSEFYDIKQTLASAISVFESMLERSAVCAKAAPILRHLL
jgi:hypothetical protein